jgi:hypothetical protein
MPLYLNNVKISNPVFNNVQLNKVYFNNVLVYAREMVREFAYTGAIQTFVVPYTGRYLLETWGAQGGDYDMYIDGQVFLHYAGGAGGYAQGYVNLNENDVLYVGVGGAGAKATNDRSFDPPIPGKGGYNGGGDASGIQRAGGGGATHIGRSNALLKDTSVANLLLCAGGGGGSMMAWNQAACTGGAGGGTEGGTGLFVEQDHSHTWEGIPDTQYGSGGTQSSGYAYGQGSPASNSLYDEFHSAAGGGYYGGHARQAGLGTLQYSGGGGGSGYIGGVSNGSMSSGIWSGNGKAKITFIE